MASITCIAWSKKGDRIATASEDETVKIWRVQGDDPSTYQLVSDLKAALSHQGHREAITAVAWEPDDERLASGDDAGRLLLWNVSDPAPENWSMVRELDGE